MNEKQNPLFRIFKLIIWIILITGVILYSNYNNFLEEKIINNKNNNITIQDGDTFYSLSRKFNIDDFYLKVYLKLNKPNFNLQKGNYEIVLGSNIEGIIKGLENPIINDDKITVLEGWNIFDIDSLLFNKGLINEGDFIKKSSNNEGFLYPDTYNVNLNNFKLDDFISKLKINFNKKVIEKLPGEIGNNKEALEKLIILSSIVEKEANIKDNPEEVAIIAGILKKRLDESWLIGADITVCYPYKLTSKECNPDFIWKHINDKNEYNTRTMLGLPKTAIGNPSYKTINATLNYKKTPYYYYLHDNYGNIHYAKTNEGHANNKNLYLK